VTAAVSAAERKRDRIALALLAAGAFLYGASYLGMHNMAEIPIVTVPGHMVIPKFTRLWLMSLLGLALFIAGSVAVAWSFARHHARGKEST
jgi:hypothetical protein